MKPMNLYLCGVGGQGIGLLAEVLGRACVAAGYAVRGCDTHGLAQRGGVVVSHLRVGPGLFTPLVPAGAADLVVAMERLEALRGAGTMLRPGGTLLYADVAWQPMSVRSGEKSYPSVEEVAQAVTARGGRVERLAVEQIPDPRMQNAALLGRLAALGVVPGLDAAVLEAALRDVVPPRALDANLEVFRKAAA